MRLQKISSLFLSVLFVTNYTFAVPIVPPSNDKLYEVITTGDVQTMKSFINNHLVTQTRTVPDANNIIMPMLSLAVQHQQPEIVKLLLNRLHVDPNLEFDVYPISPLEDAIRIHDRLLLRNRPTNTQMIKLLVQAGANINYLAQDTNESLLHIAQDPKVIEYLLQHNIDPNIQILQHWQPSKRGNTALLDACLSEQFQKAMMLLKYSANRFVFKKDNGSVTFQEDNPLILDEIDPYTFNETDQTILNEKNSSILNNVNPLILNNERKTALHILAALNTQDYSPSKKEELFTLVKKLLDQGVDPFKFDLHGKTAAQIAQENNNIEMVKFLRSHSAFIPDKIAEQSLFKSTLLYAVEQYYEGNKDILKKILKTASTPIGYKLRTNPKSYEFEENPMIYRLEKYLDPSFLEKVDKEFNISPQKTS